MALGSREIYLVIRARDEASRTLRSFRQNLRGLNDDQRVAMAAAQRQMAMGSGLTSVGIGIMAVGAAGLKTMQGFTNAAIDYNQQAAKTLTQVDQTGVSLEQIKKIGRDVAAAIPAPFEQMQSSLYDIFSSMNVNTAGAQTLLTEFSRAAVAGQVDIQQAARGTIGILNAFKLGVGGVTRVNDVMFQLVRKGVGTYDEFSKSIGRATPSAARAGQSIESLAGMMAFLTRNGLSTSMAASSAARALDAFSNPTVTGRLQKMGIAAKGANGEFRPISKVVSDLGDKMAKLTAPQRAAALQALFKGAGGTIQARRFYDLAVKNTKALQGFTDDMKNSSGQMNSAYDIMFKQPQTQMQAMKNQMAILKTTLGDLLLPAVLKTTKAFTELLQWFNNLSPGVKKLIVIIFGAVSAFMVIAGIVMTVAGVWLMLSAAAVLAGTTIGAVMATMLTITVIGAVIIAAIVLIIMYHKQIWAFMVMVWNAIKDAVMVAVNAIWAFMQSIWASIGGTVMAAVNGIKNVIMAVFNAIVPLVRANLNMLWSVVKLTWAVISATIQVAVAVIKTIVVGAFKLLLYQILPIWLAIKYGIIKPIQALWPIVQPIFQKIGSWISSASGKARDAVKKAFDLLKKYIIDPLTAAQNAVSGFVDGITSKIEGLKNKIMGPLDAIRSGLSKLNPLSHFSPSLVEQVDKGYKALYKVTNKGLDDLYNTTTKKAAAIRKQLATMKPATTTAAKANKLALQLEQQHQSKLAAVSKAGRDALKKVAGGDITQQMNAIAKIRQDLADAMKGQKWDKATKALDKNLSKMADKLSKSKDKITAAAQAMASGITLGIRQSTSPMAKAAQDMADKLAEAFKGGTIPAAVQATIDDLKDKATQIQNFRDDLVKTITKNTSLVDLFGGGERGTVVRGTDMVTKLKQLFADTQLWAAGIKELAKRGLNPDTLKELITAGPAALPIIQGMLQDNSISDINKLVSDTWAVANNVANSMEQIAFGNQKQATGADANSLGILMGKGGTLSGVTYNQQVTVNTNEIDPRANAQQLGYELVGRVGA